MTGLAGFFQARISYLCERRDEHAQRGRPEMLYFRFQFRLGSHFTERFAGLLNFLITRSRLSLEM